MNDIDYRPELPPPLVVASDCCRRSWDDDTGDRDRLLLEQASRVIGRLVKANRRLRRQLRQQQEARG